MSRLLFLALPVLAALALYAPTLRYERTFDDNRQVLAPDSTESRTFADLWQKPYWWEKTDDGGLYRPVVSTSLWLESKGGLPVGFRHAVNVCLHAAVTALFLRLLLALGIGSIPAVLGALLFAVHPIHVEAVAGIVGRAELLAAMFVLAALLLHHRNATEWSAVIWAGALSFLAAGSKESAWSLPALAVALDFSMGRGIRKARPAWIGYMAGIGVHMLIRRSVLGGWLNAPGAAPGWFDNPLATLHGWERFLGGLRVAGINLAHLVFPITLAADYSGPAVPVTGGGLDPRLWGGLILILGSLAIVSWARREPQSPARRAAFLGAVWLLVSALSVMNIAITLGTVLGDRLLYWPSVAWCGLLAAFAAFLLNPARDRGAGALRLAARDPRRPVRPPRAGIAFAVLLVALSMAYAARAAVYVPAWRNDRTLFETSVRAEPRAPRAWYNLGRSYQDEGRIDDAIRSFENAVDYSPDYEESWAQLAIGLMQAGRWEESRAPLAESLRLNPKDIVSIMNEGVLWLNTGREEDARARFLDITRKEPDRADAWHNLALADQRLGDDGGAAEAWRRVIELRPKDGAALNNLAWLLATRLADPVQAESLARRAVSMDGANAEWLDTLAEALFRQGKRDEAVRVEESALRLADAPAYREQLRRFREDPIPPAR